MTEAASLSAAGTPFSLPRFSSGGAKFVEHFFVMSSTFLLKPERFCAILDNRENCVQKHIRGGNQNCMERRRSVLLADTNEEFRTMLRRPDLWAQFDESVCKTMGERKLLAEAKAEAEALRTGAEPSPADDQ